MLELDPSYVQARSRLGAAYSAAGRHDEAIREFETVRQLTNDSPSSLTGLAEAYAGAGRRAEAERLLDQLVAERPHRYVSPGALADAYAAVGRADAALDWLEQSYRERANSVVYIRLDHVWKSLSSEPRFQAIVRAVGLP
jgi:tetratricopeptide (TPR) repeat protein